MTMIPLCGCPGSGTVVIDSNPPGRLQCEDLECCSDTECEDGDECTDNACNDGVCVFDLVVCAVGDVCDTDTGECVRAGCIADSECDDGDRCTADFCLSGVCAYRSISDSESDDDGIPDCADNCVTVANATQDDFDGDGTGDACDSDDDDDGFRDNEDPDPLDLENPGDFSTPEAILANPVIRASLQEFRDQGFVFEPSLELEPADISGTYSYNSDSGQFIATGNGDSVGNGFCPGQFSITVAPNLTFASEDVSFCNGETTSVGSGVGFVRGTGLNITSYSTGHGTCVENGSAYETFTVGISTSRIDASTGDNVDVINFFVNVAVRGELTATCAARDAGNLELVGGWMASQFDRQTRVE